MTGYPITFVDHVYAPGDMPKIKEFYTKAFGWKIDYDTKGYVIMVSDSGMKLGLYQIDQAKEDWVAAGGKNKYVPGKPVVYIDTDDIDATLTKLKDLGATIVLDKDPVPGIGFWALVDDPCGTRFALQQVTQSH
ncbi:VOC family protein [Nocardia huaxiensis]|uniref:VOC family protein n=1 Tax=Nocardia huaxiensis TaxID=2755382 RepID=UPI001E639870|nr:VOC family protein [Nocardia huaxiensis]UFS98183.1 VOC family protein [Nocardia huaxiensis]